MTPPETLRAAADLIQQVASKAPLGPYTMGPEPGYHRLILGADGDPFAHVRDWPGGIVDDYALAHHNAAHLMLWDRATAMLLAAWLNNTADAWPQAEGAFTVRPTDAQMRRAAKDLAENLLERKQQILAVLNGEDPNP